MSKKLVERTIKVASVSMAAVMATTPMVAFAEDVNLDENKQEDVQQKQEGSDENKVEQVADIETAIDDAKEAAVEANNQMEGVESFKDEKEVNITVNGEDEIDPKAGEDELEALKQNVADMQDADSEADAAEDSNNQLVNDAAGVAASINGQLATTSETMDEKKQELANATTIPEAQQVYEDAVELKDDADSAYSEAVKNYHAIQNQINENNKKIADAQLKYDNARAAGAENLQDAYEELEAARQVAADLEVAVNNAKQNLSAEAARILAAQEERDKPENKNDWKKKQAVFMAIIHDYYIPAYKEGTLVSFVRDEKAEEKDVGKAASKDGNAHNYKVVYTDSEGEHTVYLNYKWDNQGQLIIFEKTLMDIDVYRYKNGGKYVEVDPEADNVVTIDGKKYVVLDEGTSETIIAEGTKTTATGSVTTEISDTADAYVLENGQVVKVTTGTVTTITKTDKSLGGSTTKYNSEAEAEAAARNAITLENGEELVMDSLNVTTSSETTYGVTYNGEFKATIDINAWSTMVDEWFVSEADEAANARANFVSRITKMITDAGYGVVGNIDLSNISMKSYWFFNGSLTKKTYVVNGNSLITVKFKKNGIQANDVVESGSNSATRDAVASAQAHAQSVRVSGFNINKVTLTNIAATSKGTTYTYDGANYQVATTSVDENVEVAKVTYAQGKALEHVEKTGYYSNSNYDKYLKDGNTDHVIMLENPTSTKDLGLNDFLNKYKTDKQNYEDLAGKAKAAAEAYKTAEDKVNAIQDSLDQLYEEATANGFDAETIAKQAELEVALEQAEREMEEAEETLEDISRKLAEMFDQLAEKIDSLTPKTDDIVPDDDVIITPVAVAPTTPVAAPAAAATPVATPVAPAVAAPAAGAGLIAAAPVETPLANATLEAGEGENTEAPVQALNPLVQSDDIDTALANMELEDTDANSLLGWWWLLLFAIGGGTAYTIYRKYQQKKAVNKVEKK